MLKRILNLSEIEEDSLFLWGSRQTGKSTLLRSLFPKARLYDLLKTDIRIAFQLHPSLLRQECEMLNEGELVITDEVKGKYKIKEMGTEEFLGKTCQSYSAVVEQQGFEANVVYLIYKGIPLKTTTTIMGMSMVMEATSIEENIPIDQSLFAIPKK